MLVDCRPAVTLDDRGLTEAFRELVFTELKELLEEASPRQPPYSARYPGLADLDKFYESDRGVPPGGNALVRNIVLGGEWLRLISTSRETAAYADIKANFIDPDPKPVDRAALEALQQPASPAVELGFKPIPYDRIGPAGASTGASPRE